MMKKTIFVILISCLLLIACAKTDEATQQLTVSMSLTESAYDFAMQGRRHMAELAYNQSLERFLDRGGFCDMARVAIVMTSVSKNIQFNTIEDAASFATLGECNTEKNIINFLNEKEYDINTLEEPYKTYAIAETTGNTSGLQSLINDGETSNRTKSIAYRLSAKILIEKGEYAEAIAVINSAKELDSKYAWTSNLFDNELLLLQAYEKMGEDTTIVKERIKVLEQALNNKF